MRVSTCCCGCSLQTGCAIMAGWALGSVAVYFIFGVTGSSGALTGVSIAESLLALTLGGLRVPRPSPRPKVRRQR